MNRKVVVAAVTGILVGFAAGLAVGLSHRSNALRNSGETATMGGAVQSESPWAPPGRSPSVHTNSLETTNSAKELRTLADLEVAFRSQSGRDLGKAAEVAANLDTNQFGQAIASITKKLDSQSKIIALRTIAVRWGEIDPRAALLFVQSIENVTLRAQITSIIFGGWNEVDSNAALASAKQLPPGETRSLAF